MNVNNVVRTITIKGVSDGVEKLTKDVNNLAAAQQNVAVVSDTSAKRVLSLEDAWKKQTLKLDEAARSQANVARESKIADNALREGLITQQQHAERLNLITQRYTTASAATGKFTTQNGLARHELINLSRQAQDVGVSLASGQSPLLVLAQQGSQIADVFASSTGSVRGFFGQAIGWAGRFVTSAVGVTAGIVGIGAAALFMGQSFASAQKDIDRALSGIGAGSGANRGDINRIAGQAASPTGLSVSEAREAATAFAATGKIYQDNIRSATLITKDFARAMGVDASEATKTLAKDLSGDLVGAALKWNATLGFADDKTINYIQSLVSMGQKQQAINALITAAAPSIGRMAAETNKWGVAWDFVANKVSNAGDAIGRAVSRGAERLTGANFAGFEDQERLTRLRENRASRSGGQFALGLDAGAIRALDQEIAKLEQRIADMAKQGDRVRFAQMSLEARDFARSVNESTAQIERLSQGLATIEQLQARRLSSGGAVDPGLERAAEIARVQLALALEQEQVEQRKAQVISQNALKYQDTSVAVANQRELMDAQLTVAQAITGVQEIAAQREATIVQLKQQGLSLSDATAVADGQRAIATAQVNAQADRMLISLRQEGELIRASSDAERDRISARQTYENLVRSGADKTKAQLVANEQLANAEAKRYAAEQKANDDAIASIRTRQDAWDAYARGVITWSQADYEAARIGRMNDNLRESNSIMEMLIERTAEWNRRWELASGTLKNLPALLLDVMGGMDKLFDSNQGGKSQFNPQGYTSKMATPAAMFANNVYGAGGFSVDENLSTLTGGQSRVALGGRILPNAQGLEKVVDNVLKYAQGSISDAMDSLLQPNFGLGDRNTGVVQASAQTLSRLTELLPDDASKMQAIWKQIQVLSDAPQQGLVQRELIASLTDQLKQLQEATEKNTDALNAQLDPLFSQGHEYLNSLRIGYYKAATGLSGIVQGGGGTDSTPVHMMLTPGEHVQVTPPGMMPRAANSNVSNDNSRNVVNNITQNIVMAEPGPISRLTARQRAQGFITAATRAAG